jgi:hypothetical protein
MALSQYDQSVYDQGYKYIPQSKYLLNPFQVPAGSENEVPTGIATTYQAQNMMGGGGGGAGGGSNVYSPNMNQIRTDFRPDYDFRAYQEFGVTSPDQLTTEQRKQMDMNQEYFYDRPSPLQQKIGGLMNFIPGIGTVKRGAEFIGGLLKDKMPINQRAILENQLRGSGVFTDDIGRIVAGPGGYNTPEGIMAGYNANMMTAETFDKRNRGIAETIADKYGIDVTGLTQEQIEEFDPNNPAFNLVNRYGLINTSKANFLRRQQRAQEIADFRNQQRIDAINKRKRDALAADNAAKARRLQIQAAARAQDISRREAAQQQAAIERDQARDDNRGGYGGGSGGVSGSSGGGYNEGNFCFDPNTFVQMADGSEKKIKEIQLGDQTKGGEVTGVFQFKASDEIHDYKGVTVAGSHYVKEDGKFIMVKDSPISVKIDKIPVVYSLDTTGRRIFIKDIEFADYNGDGIAKGFLANAGVDLSGFDKEVLRQVENRLI